MKCEIIRDLLPAYCDCVCSVETAAEIESHVAGCADCKKLLDDYRSDIKPASGGAPEKPFRRISEKIFRNKLVITVLAVLLAAVLCGVGYLTYGQIVREPHHPSFETIISSQKAKKIVERFCEGDIDYVMENIELYQTGVALYNSRDEIREYCRTVLSDFYEKYLKGRNLNVRSGGGDYSTIALEVGTSAVTYMSVYDGKLELLDLCLVEYTGKKFIISINGYSGSLGEDFDLCGRDVDTLRLALAPVEPTPLLETAIINNAAKNDGNFKLFVNRFKETPEEKQAMADKAAAFTEDMYCENAYYTNFRFDAENSRYLIDIGFTFSEKSTGKLVSYSRTVRLKSGDYRFEILPEFEPVIIDGGISAENLEKLKKLFE